MAEKNPTSSKKNRRKGAAAIEFAMLALPFFMLILATLEVGLMLLASAMVETSTSATSRLIRTGQAQINQLEPEEIKRRFCANLSIFSTHCMERTQIDIRAVKTFGQDIAPDPLATGVFDPNVLTYQPGIPGDYVLVRVWFEHPIVTPFMANALSRSSDKKTRLLSTLAFRNEPYL